jgi:saccharopine dehydrogenase (NAD+, L-lysine-forming)
MTKVIVLGGVGQVGGVVSRTLALAEGFSQVKIGDINLERAQKLADEIGAEHVQAVKVDAMDPDSIRQAIAGCDLVVNCVGPFYKTVVNILQVTIDAGLDYIDVWDDVSVVDEIFALDAKAKDAGVTAVVGMGFSPGVTNLQAALAADKLLDETEAIDIYHAHGGEPEEGAGVIGHRFHCMTVDCPMFLDGELKTVKFFEPDGIALREMFDFLGLEPGIMVYPYPHPEQVTLPRTFDVQRVTNKGTVLPQEYYDLTMEMCALGLNSMEPLEVKGQKVIPHDFAISYIIRERDRILDETKFGVQRGASAVVVQGLKDGKPRKYNFEAYSEGGKHSGLGVSTGVPAAAAAVLLARGKVTAHGVLSPEESVNPVDFFPLWEELTAAVTGKKKPFESVVEVSNEDGQTREMSTADLLKLVEEEV